MKVFLAIASVVIVASCTTSEGTYPEETSSDPADFATFKVVSGDLAGEEIDSYELEIDDDHYVYGQVNQISLDVAVSVYDPEDNKVASFDGPATGIEHVSFETEDSGTYRIDIEPFEGDSGEYTIELIKLEEIASRPEARVDQLMTPYDNDHTPGNIVGIIREGEVVFSKGYGMANLVHDIPLESDMRSNIGSVSKQFTAMSILLLEKEGKLSIDDPLRKHMPELPAFTEKITLKNLLNHTNGLREIYNTMPLTGWKGEDDLLREQAIWLIQKQPELQVEPGEEFNYNNTAFIFLAEIVERVTGQTFPEWMKENVFGPLGMDDTRVRSNPEEIIPRSAQGYLQVSNGYREAGDLDAAYGAGAIYTTVDDIAKWLGNFHSHNLGGEEVIEKLTTPGILNNGDTMTYALGIGVTEYRGLKKFQHTGGDIAHRTMLQYYPEIQAGLFTTSNYGSYPLGTANKIADAFFAEHLEPEEPEEETTEGSVEVDPAVLESYAGKYKASSIGLIIDYKLENGQLMAYPTGQSALPLSPISQTEFEYSGIDATVEFHPEPNGEVVTATHSQGGSEIELERIPGYLPDLSELQAFTGRYYSKELETFWEIDQQGDTLVAKHRNMEPVELEPTERDQFAGSAFFMAEIKFERNFLRRVTGFSVSNGRSKGIRFDRVGGLSL